MKELHAANNQLTDISAITELSNLSMLDIDSNFISDISAISHHLNKESYYVNYQFRPSLQQLYMSKRTKIVFTIFEKVKDIKLFRTQICMKIIQFRNITTLNYVKNLQNNNNILNSKICSLFQLLDSMESFQ
ncbi:Leucine_rich repeat 4 [Hexamita inflata]|uniref:Leucine rich repeat 4 n=1 Tax=Hexamita inflata TaxID=28002 RepID=A0AA86NDP6_9EUKA|nr:Leucine rich repeat 4 [Hexamita inflata]